jgi:hypothetical protein
MAYIALSHFVEIIWKLRGKSMRRPVCEECLWLDIRLWQRRQLLRPGISFPWRWSQGGETVGEIAVRIEPAAVVLSYMAKTEEQGSKRVEQQFPIEWTACNFGGGRPWFRCSAASNGVFCGRRVAKLYLLSSIFACRNCYGLRPVEIQDSTRSLFVIQASDGTIRFD